MIKKFADFLAGKNTNEAEWAGNFGGPGRDTVEWAAMMASCMILRLLSIRRNKLTPGKIITVTQTVDFTLSLQAKEDPIMAPLAGRRFRVKLTAVVEPVE